MRVNRYLLIVLTLTLTLLLLQPAWSLAQTEIVPLSRRINWDPGVRGGIVNRTTICATLAAGSTATQIQTELDKSTCVDKVVKLAAGTFTINKTLKIPTRVTLRGAGMGQTILVAAATFSGSRLVDFGSSYDETKWALYSSRGLSSPTKGATTITTTAAHGWAVGDIVLIDMLHNPVGDPPIEGGGTLGACSWCGRAAGTRPIGQLAKVMAVPTTTTATIDPPLYWSYNNTPQATKLTGGSVDAPVPFTELAGLEDVTLDDLARPVQDLVGLMGTVSSWMLRVELKGSNRRAVWGFAGLWFTIQSCKIWGGTPIGADFDAHYHSDRAYGVFFGPHVTAALVTDSIFEKLTMAIAYEGAASGNVFSYNYIGQMWWENTGDYPHRFGPLMHGPHPFMNLLEGNNSEERFRADEYWGTSSHFTLLRNYIKQRPREGTHTSGWPRLGSSISNGGISTTP